jgi:hypothetical protein
MYFLIVFVKGIKRASVTSDSSQYIHGNVSPGSQLLEVLPERSDIVSKRSYIYSKAGAKFLAKGALVAFLKRGQ